MSRPPTKRPNRQPVFFLDRSLGAKIVPQALMQLHAKVKIHDDCFSQSAEDTDWLPVVGSRGWAVLTLDWHILTRANEVKALLKANTHVFVLKAKNPTGQQQADAFCAALPTMIRLVSNKPTPLLAFVTGTGKVRGIEGYQQIVNRL